METGINLGDCMYKKN